MIGVPSIPSRTGTRRLLALLVLAAATTTPLAAQGDSLRLGALLAAMERTDRRSAQRPIVAAQSELRRTSLDRERLPTVSALATGQYVSDVPSIGGMSMVPYQQFDAYLTLRQRLLDPTRGARHALEDAQLGESDARLRASLWQQRQHVNDAFFTLLALDAERATLAASLHELETQRRLAATRQEAGVALASEPALLDAEVLRRRQSLDALDADAGATRAVLASLTGHAVSASVRLAMPALDSAAASARRALDTLRTRPEYAQFANSRDALAARARVTARNDLPRLVAFGRSGYGRPGINPLARDFQSYWIAGVQLEWTPQLWGGSDREAEVQRLQAEFVARDEEQFSAQVQRAVQRDLAAMDRLRRTLESDDAIIALHERVAREARARFGEGSITVGELVDRETDLLNARTARALHRVHLAEAQARFLTTLGQEIP